jgi:hypothetical protein
LVRSALAAQVKAAVTRANTWHLSGWRIKEGKKLRWEVWGRRRPFFYREQVGDAVLIDDGRTRTQVIPAQGPSQVSVGQPGAVLIRRSVGRATPALSDPRAGILVGLGPETDDLRFRAEPAASEAANTVTLTSTRQYAAINRIDETTRLSVDRETRLPIRYVVERDEWKPAGTPETGLDMRRLTPLGRSTVAQLSAAYDVPLPPGIERYLPPADYAVADMTRPAPILAQAPPGPDVVSVGGLTVKGQVLGRDRDGNLFLEFSGWTGDQPMNYRLIPLSLEIDRGVGTGLGRDETGRIYVQVSDHGIIYREHPRLWLAPLRPIPAGAPRPRSVTVRLNVRLSDYERVGDSGRSVPIVTEPMTFTLAIPSEDKDLGYDAPEQWEPRGVRHIGRIPTFRERIAVARSRYHPAHSKW